MHSFSLPTEQVDGYVHSSLDTCLKPKRVLLLYLPLLVFQTHSRELLHHSAHRGAHTPFYPPIVRVPEHNPLCTQKGTIPLYTAGHNPLCTQQGTALTLLSHQPATLHTAEHSTHPGLPYAFLQAAEPPPPTACAQQSTFPESFPNLGIWAQSSPILRAPPLQV